MDDFNAKKARAQKFRQDKHHDRPKKSGHHGGKGDSKESQGNSSSKGDPRDIQGNSSKPQKDAMQGTSSKMQTSHYEKVSNLRKDSENKGSGEEEVVGDTQSFSRRKLVSNWDRYEEPVDTNRFEEDEGDIGARFEELLSMPVSGGHLKLKHEQEWEKEKSELQTPWFQLNIQTVEKNLSTIPFLKRQNLPQDIFSESQLKHMLTRAKRNAEAISDTNKCIFRLQNLGMSSETKQETVGEVKNIQHDIPVTPAQSHDLMSDSCKDDDLDCILTLNESSSNSNRCEITEPTSKIMREDFSVGSMTTSTAHSPPKSASSPTVPLAASSGSLDDWLDSILDD